MIQLYFCLTYWPCVELLVSTAALEFFFRWGGHYVVAGMRIEEVFFLNSGWHIQRMRIRPPWSSVQHTLLFVFLP